MYDNALNKQFPSPWIIYDADGELSGFDKILLHVLITGRSAMKSKG